MEEKTNYLFVYGTLLDEQNEFAIYLKQNCTFYAEGKFKGRLYDLGEYPGAIVDKTSNNDILGSILELKNSDEVLKRLDDYEGFGEHQNQPNLFIRVMVSVEASNKNIKCWVYLYNLPVDGFRVIESGDYNSYKRHS
jgi:gamma-glutamylcyclotransferase (GGCT)/AIG2-like uncharacterized protein YtfP